MQSRMPRRRARDRTARPRRSSPTGGPALAAPLPPPTGALDPRPARRVQAPPPGGAHNPGPRSRPARQRWPPTRRPGRRRPWPAAPARTGCAPARRSWVHPRGSGRTAPRSRAGQPRPAARTTPSPCGHHQPTLRPIKSSARLADYVAGRPMNGVAVSTIEDLRDQIVREERVTNLKADGTVTEAEIHRRRLQMFLLALVVLIGLLFTTVANDVWTEFRDGSWIDPELARFVLIGFGICCVLYVYDKEQHLKRLSRLGQDVQDLDAQLAAGMLRSA